MLSLLFTFALAVSAAIYYPHAEDERVADSYVVVFKKGLSAEEIAAHKSFVTNKNVSIDRHYSIASNFNGYAARMTKDTVAGLLSLEEVAYVEEDCVVHAYQDPCITQQGATWGLVRTSQRMLNLDGRYLYRRGNSGLEVTAYVIDTGILITHNDFGGRASWGSNHVDRVDTDENGHGTHCAGTVGGSTYGVAKGVYLVAVKVLNRQGSGTMQGVIAGVDWAHDAGTTDDTPSVASMSLGGSKMQALNDAVDAAATDPQYPLIVVVAGGNSNGNVASYSPASAPQAITIAASDNGDRKAQFSNFGATVTCWAPGVSITSAWIGSNTATNTISGTSMACPHVAGAVCKFLQTSPQASTIEVKAFLKTTASDGLIENGNIGGTPNLLLFADCDTRLDNNTVTLAKRF